MTSRLRSSSLAIVALACAASAQHVWKVYCQAGPGVDFTDLPPAVAAAAPGDTILVYRSYPGCPVLYTAPVINKPLRIVGFELVSFGTIPTVVGLTGTLVISGIPAGSQVVVSNVGLAQLDPPITVGLSIVGCAGQVILDDFHFASWGHPGYTMNITQCADVVLRGSVLGLGGVPLTVADSSVLLSTTELPPTYPASSNGYTQTAPGMSLINSTATLVGSIVWGSSLVDPANPALDKRPGVELDHSTLNIGPGSIVYGGYGQAGGHWLAYHANDTTTSTVHLDPRGAAIAIGVNGPPLIPTTIDATYHSWVTAGQDFGVTVVGPPGGFALLAFGDLMPFPMPTPFGGLVIDPATAGLLDLVPLAPSNGIFQWTAHCPITLPSGQPFAFQTLTLSLSGNFGLTVPSPMTVGWPYGVQP